MSNIEALHSLKEADITEDFIQTLYIVFYDRPADPEGFAYWSQYTDYPNLINAFIQSEEASTRFGHLTPEAIYQQLYQHAFNRMPTDDELAEIQDVLDGEQTLDTLIFCIANHATSSDLLELERRIEDAKEITHKITELESGRAPFYDIGDESDDAQYVSEYLDGHGSENIMALMYNLGYPRPVQPIPDPILDPDPEPVSDPEPVVEPEPVDLDETAPVFFSGSFEQKNENLPRWNPAYDAQAVDSSGEIDVGITYTLPALTKDNDLFTITSSGVVYFRQIPDYEKPIDSNKDNNYNLVIEAADEYGNSAEKTVTVRIVDVDETTPPNDTPQPPPPDEIIDNTYHWAHRIDREGRPLKKDDNSSHTFISGFTEPEFSHIDGNGGNDMMVFPIEPEEGHYIPNTFSFDGGAGTDTVEFHTAINFTLDGEDIEHSFGGIEQIILISPFSTYTVDATLNELAALCVSFTDREDFYNDINRVSLDLIIYYENDDKINIPDTNFLKTATGEYEYTGDTAYGPLTITLIYNDSDNSPNNDLFL